MDVTVTKPYKFIGFGAMDVTKPLGRSELDATEPTTNLKPTIPHVLSQLALF